MATDKTLGDNVVFLYVPWTDEAQEVTSCGIPIAYNASKEWAGKKVVLFSVPGAFTPTCSERHLPGYIERLSDLKAKGVDIVAVVASNDPFVMSAWGKANGIKDEILFLSDPGAQFAKQRGWNVNDRTGRWAMVIDNGEVRYADNEKEKGVSVSGVDAVLAHL